jgi:triacylglycerol esterase/lipase EstA (alpha/beta hydrolase family)
MWSALAPARRRLLLGLAALVVAAAVAITVGVLVHRDDSDAPTRTNTQGGAPGPVLLVPGYGGSTRALSSLAGRLRAAGRDATVVTLPGDGTGDLGQQAAALARAADSVRARTGAATVDVVGYSAGGVVARLWVLDHGGAKVARRVVTLGSPQHGTDLASLAGSLVPGACPEACRQLATDSPLLDRLNQGDETPVGPTFVSIWTTNDETVVPPDSAQLAGALNVTVQSVCPTARVSHGGLPTDPLVAQMVRVELAPGDPVALGPADCAQLSS